MESCSRRPWAEGRGVQLAEPARWDAWRSIAGITTFEPEAGGPHRYLIVTPQQRERTLEALVQLTSQPPG